MARRRDSRSTPSRGTPNRERPTLPPLPINGHNAVQVVEWDRNGQQPSHSNSGRRDDSARLPGIRHILADLPKLDRRPATPPHSRNTSLTASPLGYQSKHHQSHVVLAGSTAHELSPPASHGRGSVQSVAAPTEASADVASRAPLEHHYRDREGTSSSSSSSFTSRRANGDYPSYSAQHESHPSYWDHARPVRSPSRAYPTPIRTDLEVTSSAQHSPEYAHHYQSRGSGRPSPYISHAREAVYDDGRSAASTDARYHAQRRYSEYSIPSPHPESASYMRAVPAQTWARGQEVPAPQHGIDTMYAHTYSTQYAVPHPETMYAQGHPAHYHVSYPPRHQQFNPFEWPYTRRRRGNLPREATNILRRWYSDHSQQPYPTEEEKLHLCTRTGLHMNQVSNWFINARRRQPGRKRGYKTDAEKETSDHRERTVSPEHNDAASTVSGSTA